MSATTRMVLDSIRTVVIWAFCVIATEPYDSSTRLQQITKHTPIQVAGFVVLLIGTFVYNEREIPNSVGYDGKPIKESLIMPLLRGLGCAAPRGSTNVNIQSETNRYE